MIRPVQVTFRNMEPREALEEVIRDGAAWLETFYPDIVGCRGRATATQIATFFRTPSTRAVLDALKRHGLTVLPARGRQSGPLAGKTVVFTGALAAMTRDRAERLVEELGGRAARTVTRTTDLVVAGSAAGSKLRHARAAGVPIMSEREFAALAGRTLPSTARHRR